jgi:hypothetical protein
VRPKRGVMQLKTRPGTLMSTFFPPTTSLWEDAVLALIGDQFEEEDGIVGMVLSSRSQEDILSVWSDREGDNVTTVK